MEPMERLECGCRVRYAVFQHVSSNVVISRAMDLQSLFVYLVLKSRAIEMAQRNRDSVSLSAALFQCLESNELSY